MLHQQYCCSICIYTELVILICDQGNSLGVTIFAARTRHFGHTVVMIKQAAKPIKAILSALPRPGSEDREFWREYIRY